MAKTLLGELIRVKQISACCFIGVHISGIPRNNGCYGLLAANNICEGTAVDVGLGRLHQWGVIFWSRRDMKWPGKASVVTAAVAFLKGKHSGDKDANGKKCRIISPQLRPAEVGDWRPQRLTHTLFAFKGVDNSKGLAFVLTEESNWFEPLRNEKNSLLRPYITGNDITTTALQRIERWALDIDDKSLTDIEATNPTAHKFLLDVVGQTRTERDLRSYKGLAGRWWQFWNPRSSQLKHLRKKKQCIVFSRVTKHPVCMLSDSSWIYIEGVVLISLDREDTHAICLSSIFTEWMVAQQGAKFGVGATLRLSIREGVETFPLPKTIVSKAGLAAAIEFDRVAVDYCKENKCGLTEFMNEVGNPTCNGLHIAAARKLLKEIDCEVALAYGWADLNIERCFCETTYLSGTQKEGYVLRKDQRRAVISRLLDLNRDRFERGDFA